MNETPTSAGTTRQAPIPSGLNGRTTASKIIGNKTLKGKVAIVTGGYSGIGLETTRVLAKAGATVIVPGRTREKVQAAVKGIANVEVDKLDLMDPASVDSFAGKFITSGRPLHYLINSAGIMATPLNRDKRGYESQFATNHLGHFQLTARLWPALKQAGEARVVSVSSRAQRLGGIIFDDPNFEHTEYDRWKAYAQSKSANVLFAVELDRLAKVYGVRAFAVHPGLIPTTGIGRYTPLSNAPGFKAAFTRALTFAVIKSNLLYLPNLFKKDQADRLKTIPQGAATSVWCATADILADKGGVYCEDCDIAEAVPAGSNSPHGVRLWAIEPVNARKLWLLSEELTRVKFEF